MIDLEHPDFVSYSAAMVQGLQSLRALEPINLADWSDRHFYLPPGSSGIPGSWITAPFQRGIMLMISNDSARRVFIQKPARVGYTKILAAALCYFAARKRRSTCLWQPTDDDVKEFVADEIDPLFDFVPSLGEALIANPNAQKDPRNTKSRKEFIGAFLHFKGGRSAANYRRMTLDVAMLDELDGFDATVRGTDGKNEGSPIFLSNVRITDSPYGRQIAGSTPTVRGLSMIESELEACEVVLERYVRCPYCDEAQRLEWGTKRSAHGIKWDHGEPKTARYVCIGCGARMEWGDINLIDSRGYWASDRVRLDDTGDGAFLSCDTGEPVAFPESIGFKFSTLISPFFSWAQMVTEHLKAAEKMALGERGEMASWVNTRLGETWAELEMTEYDPLALMDRAEVYETEVPLGVVCITAGVDVQIDRFEIEFRGWGVGEESWGLQYVKLIGDTTQVPDFDDPDPGAVSTVYDQLFALLSRRFVHPVFGDMGVTIAAIDSGYQTSNIYAFCRQSPRTFIPVKGVGASMGREIVEFSGKAKEGVYLTLVGSDNAMDVIHGRLALPCGPGAYHWPRDNPGFGEGYFRQLLAEKRVKKVRSGRPYMTWVCPPNARNEPADTAKYNLAAIKLAQSSKGVVLVAPNVALMGARRREAPDASRFRTIASRINGREGRGE